METAILFKTRNGLSEETRESMNTLINKRLADIIVLRGLAKQMHWNVKGPHFKQLHETFDEAAGALTEPIDMLAERTVAIGGVAEGTVRMAARNSDLADIDIRVTQDMEALKALADRWGETANLMRDAINQAGEAGDEVTVDLFTEITRLLDKHLYFLEAHVQ
ncbi:MAG: DNA starvation/stationary phase protection protein Dps [Rhodothermales bacterium]|nr:DNA starvation/stationary phase protection protein Dps [Rhodothermales bacterium]